MAVEKEEDIKKANNEYEYLTGDEDAKRIAFLKMKYELDYNSGMDYAKRKGEAEGEARGEARGRAEGEYESKINIAKKMKTLKKDIDEIIEITGLTKEEIEKL